MPSAAHMLGDRWQARWRDAGRRAAQGELHPQGRRGAAPGTAVADIARGTYVDPRAGKITLREYAPGVLAASPADAPTRERQEVRWRVHILPALGGEPLGRLAARPSLVQSFVAGLTRSGLGDGTVKVILASLSSVLGAAVADGLIGRNPCASAAVKAPRYIRPRVVPWTAERVSAMRAALPARYQAMADAGAGLGLRQGEAFGLAVDDVDWLHRVVHVRRQVRIVGFRLVFAPPKGGKERDVPLPASVGLRLSASAASWPPAAVTLPWRVPDGPAGNGPAAVHDAGRPGDRPQHVQPLVEGRGEGGRCARGPGERLPRAAASLRVGAAGRWGGYPQPGRLPRAR